MTIPPAHSNRCVYHFTHLDNLPRILSIGFLCNNHPKFPKKCKSIAEPGIQDRRAAMAVPCAPGGVVHDYVPLYFGSLSPMLLGVINKKNIDQLEVLYFEFPISLLTREDVIFTDASANTIVPPNFYTDPADLANLNWAEIDSRKWESQSEDLRHQRMAEVLVHHRLDVKKASRVVVWNEEIRKRVLDDVKNSGLNFPPVTFEAFERPHYFRNFFEKGGKRSVVTGPTGIARQ